MSRTDQPDTNDEMVYAVGLYALGKISEEKAAEIAGVTRWDMREIREDAGVALRHDPQTVEGAAAILAPQTTNELFQLPVVLDATILSNLASTNDLALLDHLTASCVTVDAGNEKLRAGTTATRSFSAPSIIATVIHVSIVPKRLSSASTTDAKENSRPKESSPGSSPIQLRTSRLSAVILRPFSE